MSFLYYEKLFLSFLTFLLDAISILWFTFFWELSFFNFQGGRNRSEISDLDRTHAIWHLTLPQIIGGYYLLISGDSWQSFYVTFYNVAVNWYVIMVTSHRPIPS